MPELATYMWLEVRSETPTPTQPSISMCCMLLFEGKVLKVMSWSHFWGNLDTFLPWLAQGDQQVRG